MLLYQTNWIINKTCLLSLYPRHDQYMDLRYFKYTTYKIYDANRNEESLLEFNISTNHTYPSIKIEYLSLIYQRILSIRSSNSLQLNSWHQKEKNYLSLTLIPIAQSYRMYICFFL